MIAQAAGGEEQPGGRRRRGEFEEREWQLVRAYALGMLPARLVAWLWWSLNNQATTWRNN